MVTPRGVTLIAVTTTFLILSLFTLSLRVFTRCSVTQVRLGLEDGFLILAWIIAAALWAMVLKVTVDYGVGKHLADFTPYEWEHLINVLQIFWACVFLYSFSLAFVKFSLFLQYLRLFPTGFTRWASWAGVALVSANLIWGTFVNMFFCNPVRKVWDPLVPGSCLPQKPFFFALAGSNIATSCIIILVPIPAILKLQMAWKTKCGVLSIFFLGIFDIILSVLRLTSVRTLAETKDITYDLVPVGIWSLLEAFVAVMCASLAILRPLFRTWAKQLFGMDWSTVRRKNLTSSAARTHGMSGVRSATFGRSAARVDEEEPGELDSESTQSFGLRPTESPSDAVPLGKIHVKQEVLQTWHG